MLSMSVLDIDTMLTPELIVKVKKQYNKKNSVHFETLHRRKDGSTFPVEVSAKIIELEKPYILSIVRDITEQLQAQELLRKSEEKFRSLVESTSDWIWEIDKNGIYTYVSPQSENLIGYEPHELLGRSPFEFMLQEEAERVGGLFENIVDGRAQIVALENVMIHKNGHLVTLETGGSPYFDEKGEFLGYRGIDRDITERKQSENSLNHANRALKTLSAGNLALVHAVNEDELLHTVTSAIVETGGYSLATVVYAEDEMEKSMIL